MSEQLLPPAPNPDLVAAIRAEIDAAGTIPFARYMELALYHDPHGYYLSPRRRPGRGGDFITSPELHPYFGITLGRVIHAAWERLGRPTPFTILEYGSGIGGLAWDVLAGLLDRAPELRPDLRYLLNEANPHRTGQALAAMRETGLDDVVTADDGSPVTGIVLANEVADALPVHRLRWTGDGFEEIHVGWEDGAGFVDVVGPLSAEALAFDPVTTLTSGGVDLAALPVGARLEVSPAARAWMGEIATRLERGYALLIDYGYAAAELYAGHRLEGLVRAYREHTVSDDPYLAPGEQDLTAHVDFSALIDRGQGAGLDLVGLTTQSDFLANAGLGDLLVAAQHEPGMSVEEYLRAQAAVYRLIDPAGLGRFMVLGMARKAPLAPPLPGFAGTDRQQQQAPQPEERTLRMMS